MLDDFVQEFIGYNRIQDRMATMVILTLNVFVWFVTFLDAVQRWLCY
jgi:hypothetical protein